MVGYIEENFMGQNVLQLWKQMAVTTKLLLSWGLISLISPFFRDDLLPVGANIKQ